MTDQRIIDPNRIYSVEDLISLLNTSRNTIFKLIDQKRLPDLRVGKKHLWTGSVVLNSLATPAHPSMRLQDEKK